MINLNREQIKALSIFSTKTDLQYVVLEAHPERADQVRVTLWNENGSCREIDLHQNGKATIQPSIL
jgi:hypothetical protein